MTAAFHIAALAAPVGFVIGALVALDEISAQRWLQQEMGWLSATTAMENVGSWSASLIGSAVFACILAEIGRRLAALAPRLSPNGGTVAMVTAALSLFVLGLWQVRGNLPFPLRSPRGLLVLALIAGLSILASITQSASSRGRWRGIRTWSLVVLGTAVVVAATAGGFWVLDETWRARGPNLLLVYLDTLRADHLGSYGYGRQTSPNIDSLAREGVRFAQTISASSVTYPSVPSTLTSQLAAAFFDNR
ncbi:MAG: sulfatase-like hydrolase/transferase [Candidatus Binatia bacterium]